VLFRLTDPPVALAPLVCFEDTLGYLGREAANLGAHLFVTVTNTGWFKQSAAGRQHLAHAIFRCAENRRPMVRCANNGATAFLDDLGRVTHLLQDPSGNIFAEGVLSAEIRVPVRPPTTFYMRHGDLFSQACLVVTFAALGLAIFRPRA